jgi:hypothetical protein
MESYQVIISRWRYLRDLLIQQLGQFESGAMRMHEAGVNVTTDAIWVLKQNIQDFDTLIAKKLDEEQ